MLQRFSLEFFDPLEKQNRDELIGICAPLGLPIIIFISCSKNLEIFFYPVGNVLFSEKRRSRRKRKKKKIMLIDTHFNLFVN